MKKFLLFLLLLLFVASVSVGVFAVVQYKKIDSLQLNNDQTLELRIEDGTSLHLLRRKLLEYAEINSYGFRLWVKLHPEFNHIQAGLYEIPANVPLKTLLEKLNKGQVKQFSVTLLEGLTYSQWLDIIEQQSNLINDISNIDNLYHLLIDDEKSFCANEYQSLEGCFLPDTYYYSDGDNASTILKRAYTAMEETLDVAWQNRFMDIPINNKYQLLILASIIEKETAIENERSEIAGVFVNRLDRNMRLQTDPTVIYGVGDAFDGNLTRKHLKTPTPYNTYVIKGLPITPIAMPNKASIMASAQPAITDALYFVASGDGGHYFSSSLEEHNRAVQRYLNILKNKRESEIE